MLLGLALKCFLLKPETRVRRNTWFEDVGFPSLGLQVMGSRRGELFREIAC